MGLVVEDPDRERALKALYSALVRDAEAFAKDTHAAISVVSINYLAQSIAHLEGIRRLDTLFGDKPDGL